MKTHYLFPNHFKKIGLALVIPGILLGTIYFLYDPKPEFLELSIRTATKKIVETNLFDEILGITLIIGLIFLGFSKEKIEDELISKIRLESLVWATYFNYLILMLTIILCYDMTFYWVMVFNMFTILLFFIVRFNWVLYKSKKQIRDEE